MYVQVADHLCQTTHAQALVHMSPVVAEHFALISGVLVVLLAGLLLATKLTWKIQPVFTKKV